MDLKEWGGWRDRSENLDKGMGCCPWDPSTEKEKDGVMSIYRSQKHGIGDYCRDGSPGLSWVTEVTPVLWVRSYPHSKYSWTAIMRMPKRKAPEDKRLWAMPRERAPYRPMRERGRLLGTKADPGYKAGGLPTVLSRAYMFPEFCNHSKGDN